MYVLAIAAALAAAASGTSAAVLEPRTEIRHIMWQVALWCAVITVALWGLAFLERAA